MHRAFILTAILAMLFCVICFGGKREQYENTNNPYVTMYYAPWCGASKQMLPNWSELERHVSENNLAVNVRKVDCELDKATCNAMGIQSYPTVIFSHGNKKDVLVGARPVSQVIDFIRKNNAN